jgi:hypothetical protein
MRRHIAATPICKLHWEREIMGPPSNIKETQKSTTTHLELDDSTFDNPNSWDDLHDFIPEPSPDPAHIEEVDNEGFFHGRKNPDTKLRRFVKPYPRPVGIAVGQGKTKFQVLYEKHTGEGENIYAPFLNNEEWELAQWLSRRVGQKAIDEYLKLSIVSPEVDF